MAATDQFYRKQKSLHVVFGVTCLLMFLSIIWMLVQDYSREFKTVQRTFRDVEETVSERLMLDKLPEEDRVEAAKQDVFRTRNALGDARASLVKPLFPQSPVADKWDSLHTDYQSATASPDTKPSEVAKKQTKLDETNKEMQKLLASYQLAEKSKRTATYQEKKADYDSVMSYFDIDVEKVGHAHGESAKNSAESAVANREKRLAKLKEDLDKAQTALDEINRDIDEKVRWPLRPAEESLAAAEDNLKKLTDAFDRFAKNTAQKRWKLGDTIRNLPIIDGFAAPTRINQITLNELPIDYGGFKDVTRYDRCTTCHLGIERATFDRDTLARIGKPVRDLAALREEDPDAYRQIQNLFRQDSSEVSYQLKQLQEYAGQIQDSAKRTALQAALAEAAGPFTKEKVENGEVARLTPEEVASKLTNLKRALLGTPREIAQTLTNPTQKDDTLARIARLAERIDHYLDLEASLRPSRKIQSARKMLEDRQKAGESLGFNLNDLPTSVRTVKLTDGQVSMYCAHPRLDLFVDANSAHPMEKFGCTSCHAGQGSATDFQQATHSPNDALQKKQWEASASKKTPDGKEWSANHDWDFPMSPKRFVESGCLKCHHQVTDLIREGNREEAPKLLKGYNLLRENGCFGCHDIAGVKSGRWVGPDVRLEPTPPVEWLPASEQAKLKADANNPPGTMRKVGPSLRRLDEKTNEAWVRQWIADPRGFRPDTKMPHFYGLSNNSPEVLLEQQKQYPEAKATLQNQEKYPAAEIRAIAHYLFTESKNYLEARDISRRMIEAQLAALYNGTANETGLKKGFLTEKTKKALDDLTKRYQDVALMDAPMRHDDINELVSQLKAVQELLQELHRRGGKPDDDARKKEIEAAVKNLDDLFARLKTVSTPVQIAKEVVDGNGKTVPAAMLAAGDAADAKKLTEGRLLFSEKGCLACHSHEATTKGGTQEAPDIASQANFGPELSRITAKLSIDGKTPNRRWLVQWLLNPNVHHPRTRMPVTQLTPQDASAIADWLLSQKVDEKEWKPSDVANSALDTYKALARLILVKTPGISRLDVDNILETGLPERLRTTLAWDADEQAFALGKDQKVEENLLKWYVGKKAINRLGCFGCHDIPGFEAAKPIGTALNEWGKKDPERLAFEDSEAFVRGHYHIATARTNKDGTPFTSKDGKTDWKTVDGKHPFEKFFFDALEHHQRDGFLHLKLSDPRSFDYARLRAWDDRLRMPQYHFARSKKKPGETDEQYETRQETDEAEAREAVMTFVLGLVAEPVPPKYVNKSGTDRLAEVKGRQVIDKFNCAGCHPIRPGVWEYKIPDDPELRKEVLALLTRAHNTAAKNSTGDHVFPNSNAWTGTPQVGDKLTIHGTNPGSATLPDDPDLGLPEMTVNTVRLAQALRFTDAQGIPHDIPAGETVLLSRDGNLRTQWAEVLGGTFGDLLVPFLAKRDSTLYDLGSKGRTAVPPPLLREGERVQPKWLYQFLLNPNLVRPSTVLRMPKFNLSEDEAMSLVNYFAAADRSTNPGASVTYPYLAIPQREEKFWQQKNQDYVGRMSADERKKRLEGLKPLWEAFATDRLAEQEAALKNIEANIKSLKEAEAKAPEASKADYKLALDGAEKSRTAIQDEIKTVKGQLDKKDFSTLDKQYLEHNAYAIDTYRLLTDRTSPCLQCHSVGAVQAQAPQGPNLDLTHERLRPEWTAQWTGNPRRLFSYDPNMPANFSRDKEDTRKTYVPLFDGTMLDMVQGTRDALMNLPAIADLPINRMRSKGGAK